jgi:hypothetical protein
MYLFILIFWEIKTEKLEMRIDKKFIPRKWFFDFHDPVLPPNLVSNSKKSWLNRSSKQW